MTEEPEPESERPLTAEETFTLADDALAEWEQMTTRPARDLPGLRRLMGRRSSRAEALADLSGSMDDEVFEDGYLDDLRSEWPE